MDGIPMARQQSEVVPSRAKGARNCLLIDLYVWERRSGDSRAR
jgi:hypothetical protein